MSHYILIKRPWNRYYCHPHFTEQGNQGLERRRACTYNKYIYHKHSHTKGVDFHFYFIYVPNKCPEGKNKADHFKNRVNLCLKKSKWKI